jgi:catechol 2,3-dioxygenase-like lactoylglutathione lyase family enzyme
MVRDVTAGTPLTAVSRVPRHYAAPMLQSSDIIAFVPATSLERGREFYEHTLGLRVIGQSQFACVFDAHGSMLRLTAVAEVATPGYTVLGWHVANIGTAVAALAAKGVVFRRYDGMGQDEQGIWTTPGGDKIAWFTDPDGSVLSLTEFAQAGDQPKAAG